MSKNPMYVGKVKDSSDNTLLLPYAAGTHATAGGDATETITVAGAAAGDYAVVYVSTVGATPRTVNGYGVGAEAITVSMSGDPSTDHVLSYVLFRTSS